MCMVIIPPGARSVICVKLISFTESKLSINEIPVSDAPTTTILVLLLTLTLPI